MRRLSILLIIVACQGALWAWSEQVDQAKPMVLLRGTGVSWWLPVLALTSQNSDYQDRFFS